MMSKQKNIQRHILAILMVFAIIFFINLFFKTVNKRFDFTKDNIYTLSDYSKQLVSSLDDIVTIEYYITKNLPPHAISMKQRISDILNEYKAYANDKINVNITTFTASKETRTRMAELGIPRFQMNIIEQDKQQAVEAYSGIALFYDNKTEIIPLVLTIETLEYDLSLAIKKITTETIPEIGILSTDTKEFSENHKTILQALKQQYNVSLLDINTPISPNITTLIINNPSATKNNTYAIDQFIMKGGNALFLVSPFSVTNSLEVIENKDNVIDLINHYGVTIENSIILDESFAYAPFSEGYYNYRLPYPYWPLFLKKTVTTNHPSFKSLDHFVLPWAYPLVVNQNATNNKTVRILAKTSPKSWTTSIPANLNPRQTFSTDTYSQYNTIISIEGTLTSYFTSQPKGLASNFIAKSQDSKVIIMGSSHFGNDTMTNQFPNNAILYLNMIDWLTLDDNLLAIPDRINTNYPLTQLSFNKITLIKWSFTLIVPLIITVISFIRLWYNRKNKPL